MPPKGTRHPQPTWRHTLFKKDQMKAKTVDWISLIEVGYYLEGDDQQWLDGIVASAVPLFDPAGDPEAWTYSVTPSSLTFGIESTSKTSNVLRQKLHEEISSAVVDVVYRSRWVIATGSEYIWQFFPDQFETFQKKVSQIGAGASDVWGVKCSCGTGSGIIIAMALKKCRKPTAMERKRWSRVAAHLGAALRLRKVMQRPTLDAEPVEAVLDSSGNVHEVRAPTVEMNARENLREAVRRIERSRTMAGRNDPDTALDNW
jgi:hypothetical protein